MAASAATLAAFSAICVILLACLVLPLLLQRFVAVLFLVYVGARSTLAAAGAAVLLRRLVLTLLLDPRVAILLLVAVGTLAPTLIGA
ncbi:MAG TPA: hypothetical protein VNT42_09200 [Sphingomonas sp.]|nr:hypothetical protein [Sphingomonas sp.]